MTASADMNYQSGTPSLSEWDGQWKFDPREPEVSRQEYEEVSREFDNYGRKAYIDSPKFLTDFYVRGDYTGDRTQVVEIRNPSILTPKLLHELQQWLSEADHRNWRVLIPTYLSKLETIIIYPSIIRISPRYEASLEDGINIIASKMRKYV